MNIIKKMWNYAKETDAYSEKTEKLLCWLMQYNSTTAAEMEDYFSGEEIEKALERLEKAAAVNDGPNDLKNGYFTNDEEYVKFLNFSEKAQWISGKWRIPLSKILSI